MLVRRGASVTYRDELGNAPLHEAVRKNMIEVVKVTEYGTSSFRKPNIYKFLINEA